MGRPRKNKDLLIGRAGRIAIMREDRARDALRWERRKQTIEKFKAISKLQDTDLCIIKEVNGSEIMSHETKVRSEPFIT